MHMRLSMCGETCYSVCVCVLGEGWGLGWRFPILVTVHTLPSRVSSSQQAFQALRGYVTGRRRPVTNKGSYLRLKLDHSQGATDRECIKLLKKEKKKKKWRTSREGDATQRQRWRNADRCALLSLPLCLSHITAMPLNYEWGPRASPQRECLLLFIFAHIVFVFY